jgi:hypothetical protein
MLAAYLVTNKYVSHLEAEIKQLHVITEPFGVSIVQALISIEKCAREPNPLNAVINIQ